MLHSHMSDSSVPVGQCHKCALDELERVKPSNMVLMWARSVKTQTDPLLVGCRPVDVPLSRVVANWINAMWGREDLGLPVPPDGRPYPDEGPT
jgi:hypothetical protein